MVVQNATLTVVSSTPYSAQLRFEATAAGTSAFLKKSGATGGDADLTSFCMGPLRECLQRSADWRTLPSQIILRMTVDGVRAVGSTYAQELSYTPNGVFGSPGAIGVTVDCQGFPAQMLFSSGPGPALITIELRLVHSSYR